MARITVDDCLKNVENRFDLIMLAGQRARELGSGAMPTVPPDHDKPTMIALRELAAGTVRPATLQDTLIKGMQHIAPDDDDSVPTNSDKQREFARYARNSPCISIDYDAIECDVAQSETETAEPAVLSKQSSRAMPTPVGLRKRPA